LDVQSLDIGSSPFGPKDYIDDDPIIAKSEKRVESKAKSTPPNADEWQRFFARFVVRGITRGYMALVLRDLEDELSPADKAKLKLTDDDLMELAAPMAGFSSKNAYMKKHGRTIISAVESSESLIGLVFWMRRVNKIASKYRKNQPVQGTVTESRTERIPDNVFLGSDDGEQLPGPRYSGQFFPGTSG